MNNSVKYSFPNHEESTPLLSDQSNDTNHKYVENNGFRNDEEDNINFHRNRPKVLYNFFSCLCWKTPQSLKLQPIDALNKLTSTGVSYHSMNKSNPVWAPQLREAKDVSPGLARITQFRHWWKSARLLVRYAGLYIYAIDPVNWDEMVNLNIMKTKGPKKAFKFMKKMGQGGPLKAFLNKVQPFTRFIRIVVALWRVLEATEPRRGEVAVRETMAFFGNRCSRIFAKDLVDWIFQELFIPFIIYLIEQEFMGKYDWNPVVFFIVFGFIRATVGYIASFQGSRFGRVITKATFRAAGDRWLPAMRINDLSLTCDECIGYEESTTIYKNKDLLDMVKLVAKALGKDIAAAADFGTKNTNDVKSINNKNINLKELNFNQIGCGSGGYAVYSHKPSDTNQLSMLLHVTPYGPSLLDELPRYIVLECENSIDSRSVWSKRLQQYLVVGTPLLEGYCYKGAFFSTYQFASLINKYNRTLIDYEHACKAMTSQHPSNWSPPTDLKSLKLFIETGRPARKRTKHAKLSQVLDHLAQKIASQIKLKMKSKNISPLHSQHGSSHGSGSHTSKELTCYAPAGVILYFEGLDCAGKSSTGQRVLKVLESSGYDVKMCQYNRPPTAEQKKLPWMGRFDVPDIHVHDGSDTAATAMLTSTTAATTDGATADGGVSTNVVSEMESGNKSVENKSDSKLPDTAVLVPFAIATATTATTAAAEDDEKGNSNKQSTTCVYKGIYHRHAACVWDRGPAGDFVYGAQASLTEKDNQQRESYYKQFMAFDAQCHKDNILFFKMLFVTDRDSIASTLGKRLAHKKICKDLRAWLDANTSGIESITNDGNIYRAGLTEIEKHIDPTDFIAFNSYYNNLQKFVRFAKNTDTNENSSWFNPWLVICTTDRQEANIQLLHRFEKSVVRFISSLVNNHGQADYTHEQELSTMKRHRYIVVWLLYLTMAMLVMAYIYIMKAFESDGD